MVRDIRSTPLRYGLALGAFLLAMLVILGLPRITSLRIDLTSLIILVMIGSAWYLGCPRQSLTPPSRIGNWQSPIGNRV